MKNKKTKNNKSKEKRKIIEYTYISSKSGERENLNPDLLLEKCNKYYNSIPNARITFEYYKLPLYIKEDLIFMASKNYLNQYLVNLTLEDLKKFLEDEDHRYFNKEKEAEIRSAYRNDIDYFEQLLNQASEILY